MPGPEFREREKREGDRCAIAAGTPTSRNKLEIVLSLSHTFSSSLILLVVLYRFLLPTHVALFPFLLSRWSPLLSTNSLFLPSVTLTLSLSAFALLQFAILPALRSYTAA